MERLIGTYYARFVHVWLDTLNQAFGKQCVKCGIGTGNRVFYHPHAYVIVGYGYVLRESHDLVTDLALESAGNGKSEYHHGKTYSNTGSGNDNSRTRAAFYALVPTVKSSGQKSLHFKTRS